MRGDSGFLTEDEAKQRQVDRNDALVELFPSVQVGPNRNRVHVFQEGGRDWQVWINTEAMEFDGLCIGCGETRNDAIAQAVEGLEAIIEELQKPYL